MISDSVVGHTYAARVAHGLRQTTRTHVFTFPAGEQHKTRKTWSTLTDQMIAAGVGRDAIVVAVGGGVVGDVAGFVAATYLRGIPFIQVPTTLLAMIDSSIGGKTGVDTRVGKNLVGAFHQPRLVVADPSVLATLPANELAAGVAEAIKHGAIADADYLAQITQQHARIVAREPEALIELVARSIEIKAAVVAADEREAGRRSTLNFGHTVGHAIETTSGYGLLHGEAVAVGMTLEASLGERIGVTQPSSASALRSALTLFDLPTTIPDYATVEALVEAMHHDKKNREGTIRLALLRRLGEIAKPGDGSWTHPVDEADLGATLHLGF